MVTFSSTLLVTKNLHQLATELWEKQQQNSANSSQPPSKNNPYTSLSKRETESTNSDSLSESEQTGRNHRESQENNQEQKDLDESNRSKRK